MRVVSGNVPARMRLDFKMNFFVTIFAADCWKFFSANCAGNPVVAFVRFEVTWQISLAKFLVANGTFGVLEKSH